jgi:hypothetical protein
MIILSIMGMFAGLGILMFIPLSKDWLIRQSWRALGGVLFSAGLVGFISTIV